MRVPVVVAVTRRSVPQRRQRAAAGTIPSTMCLTIQHIEGKWDTLGAKGHLTHRYDLCDSCGVYGSGYCTAGLPGPAAADHQNCERLSCKCDHDGC